jgi:lipopolysaccharide/colanic/teichoic acid biosynthesis glycosyltransferase
LGERLAGFQRCLKRFFDIVTALLALVLLFPVLLVTSILVAIKLGNPVFFIQERPGLNGKAFKLIKFRSMSNALGAQGQLLSDQERLGTFGKFLRKSSLDELPELWNVLKGEMSFVGPRPLLMQYLDRYSPRQARRHEVRPGLTGWAQVNGRNALSWEERFEMDVWYVDHWSLCLDIKILFKTIAIVLGQKGVNAEGEATMSEFKGSAK